MKWIVRGLLLFLLLMIGGCVVFQFTKTDAAPLPVKAPSAVVVTNFDAEAKMLLASFGYVVSTPERYTKAVQHWQKVNGIWNKSCQCWDGEVGPITIASLRDAAPQQAPQSPQRAKKPKVAPPAVPDAQEPSAPAEPVADDVQGQSPSPNGAYGRPAAPDIDRCREMSAYRRDAGLPPEFDAIGFGESSCKNTAANSCCKGWWQNYLASHLSGGSQYRDRIINECGVNSVDDILGESDRQKRGQACVTAVVYSISGLGPWAL